MKGFAAVAISVTGSSLRDLPMYHARRPRYIGQERHSSAGCEYSSSAFDVAQGAGIEPQVWGLSAYVARGSLASGRGS